MPVHRCQPWRENCVPCATLARVRSSQKISCCALLSTVVVSCRLDDTSNSGKLMIKLLQELRINGAAKIDDVFRVASGALIRAGIVRKLVFAKSMISV